MSYVMLPSSSHAIPATNTERGNAQADAYQPPPGGRRSADVSVYTKPQIRNTTHHRSFILSQNDPLDEPGAEMTKEGRVWRTYVREADRWDKEMVEGRNNSLDVLLIFAALFSAISTAFTIESLGDLKPDSAESSAQTLFLMSQTLAAIANGENFTMPTEFSDPTPFSPSASSMVVNVLWLVSLSLSVAVSLVAMLAKEWCYKFMSSRSGQMYEQARRRQLRWNDESEINQLFTFGLIGLLPHINLGLLEPQVVGGSSLYNILTNKVLGSCVNQIHTLPNTYSWATHCAFSYKRFIPPLTEVPEISNVDADLVSLYISFLRARLPHHKLFVSALGVLFHVKSKELQDACIYTLTSLPVASSHLQLSALLENEMLAVVFSHSSMLAQHTSICTFYSKLFIATIMLSSVHTLHERRETLSYIICCRFGFEHLEPKNENCSFPTEDYIVQLVAQELDRQAELSGVNPIIQLAVDFCRADPSKYPNPIPLPGDSEGGTALSWADRLQEIKGEFDLRYLGLEHAGSACSENREVAASEGLPGSEANRQVVV